ncbi:MAG: multidrug effflux MFS transporter [Proteobacteria bacterium]|nr:multidrug effflux MFS transporter [Pseudomonadota bacterium]
MASQEKTARPPGGALFVALVLVAFLGPLSIHLFIPVLPFVRQAFGVEAGEAQLAFSLAILSMALATPVYGTLSDRYGRLPVMIGGIGLFTVGAALSALAPSIQVLIAGRMVQGAGAACGMVLARAVARDIYGPDRLGQMIAYLTAALVLGPMIGPPLGGLLTDYFGWQANLAVPAVFGVVAITVAITLIGETKPADLYPPAPVMRGYWRLMSNSRFWCFALNQAIASGAFFALNAAAVYLMVETLGRPATEFGIYFMLGPIGYMAGTLLAGRLSGRFSGSAQIIFGSVVSLLGSLSLLGLIVVFGITPLSLFIPSLILSFGQGFSNPHAQAAAIAVEDTLTGTASGIVVFLYLAVVAAMTQLVTLAQAGTVTLLVVLMISSGVVALALGIAGVRLTRRFR